MQRAPAAGGVINDKYRRTSLKEVVQLCDPKDPQCGKFLTVLRLSKDPAPKDISTVVSCLGKAHTASCAGALK